MESTGPDNPIDPFDYITIASLCMGTFRAKFLPKKLYSSHVPSLQSIFQ